VRIQKQTRRHNANYSHSFSEGVLTTFPDDGRSVFLAGGNLWMTWGLGIADLHELRSPILLGTKSLFASSGAPRPVSREEFARKTLCSGWSVFRG